MLKNLLNSCFDAYRGSHKSVVAGRHIATDISFPTGYENVNANTYVPPCDGVFVIQCEPAEGYAYYNLTVRRDQLDCGYVWIDGAAQNIKAHIRFYPYIGS